MKVKGIKILHRGPMYQSRCPKCGNITPHTLKTGCVACFMAEAEERAEDKLEMERRNSRGKPKRNWDAQRWNNRRNCM